MLCFTLDTGNINHQFFKDLKKKKKKLLVFLWLQMAEHLNCTGSMAFALVATRKMLEP